MTEIKGNKGEWSEIYVFLKLLADGILCAADGDMNPKDDLYYNIVSIIRNEDGTEIKYVESDDGRHVDIMINDEIQMKVSRMDVHDHASHLLETIKNSSGSFSDEPTERFMTQIRCHKLKAPSNDKSDIDIEIHDHRTGMNPRLGFSIKSMLGSPSSLVNASKATNFTFFLHGDPEYLKTRKEAAEAASQESKKRNLNKEYQDMVDHGVTFEFVGADNRVLKSNLRLIDGDLPQIVGEMLKLYYIEGVRQISKQVEILNERNPLHFDRLNEIPSYEIKVKRLLSAYALGMQSGSPWNGVEEASGGYILVTKDGDVLCYHLYNRNDFEDYLFKNTMMETASTTRHGFSLVEPSFDGNYELKLNLQIRFM